MTDKTEPRVALAGALDADAETRDTIAAWTERARRLVAFVKERCPPDLPPITVYVSPLKDAGQAGPFRP